MFKYIMIFVSLVLLIGCASKKESALMKSYKEKINYHKKLQKTEKIQFYEDNVTKVMLTATYLYTPILDKNDTRDEKFIIGLHLEEYGAKALGHSLRLNATKAKEVKVLSQNDLELKELSFISDWGEYYLVTFSHVKGKKLTLVFESEQYGKGKLYFAKVAKYVFTEEAF